MIITNWVFLINILMSEFQKNQRNNDSVLVKIKMITKIIMIIVITIIIIIIIKMMIIITKIIIIIRGVQLKSARGGKI